MLVDEGCSKPIEVQAYSRFYISISDKEEADGYTFFLTCHPAHSEICSSDVSGVIAVHLILNLSNGTRGLPAEEIATAVVFICDAHPCSDK